MQTVSSAGTKIFIGILILLAFSIPVYGQSAKYFNNFQKFVNDSKNIDSAYYYANLLAIKNPKMFQELIHESFVQKFIAASREENDDFSRNLLGIMLKSSNKELSECVMPISYFVKAYSNVGKPAELKIIANNFIANQLKDSKGFPCRTERYALLIHQILIKEKDCDGIADVLLNSALNNLQGYIENADKQKTGFTGGLRAWYRYLTAYCNYVLAEKYIKKGDKLNSAKYFKIASAFSPDESDKNYSGGFNYDMNFLFPESPIENFKDKYLAFLGKGADKGEILKVLTEKAIIEPENIEVLKSFYEKNFNGKGLFIKYWEDELNKSLKPAPFFSLTRIDGINSSLDGFKGKWVLVDFWGTWCGPCVEEIPKMQEFYNEVISKYKNKIEIITVACRDTELSVKDFMKKNNYSFPCAMADNKIEKDFNISVYPTKILIAPAGKYLIIPVGDDWIKKIRLYSGI